MITTAWQLGSTAPPAARFRAWAHMLGYGGHFLTKSRRYSVTFGQLRAARTDHRRATRHPGTANATPGAGPSTKPSSWSSQHLDLRRDRLHATPAAELAARLRRPCPRALRPGHAA